MYDAYVCCIHMLHMYALSMVIVYRDWYIITSHMLNKHAMHICASHIKNHISSDCLQFEYEYTGSKRMCVYTNKFGNMCINNHVSYTFNETQVKLQVVKPQRQYTHREQHRIDRTIHTTI